MADARRCRLGDSDDCNSGDEAAHKLEDECDSGWETEGSVSDDSDLENKNEPGADDDNGIWPAEILAQHAGRRSMYKPGEDSMSFMSVKISCGPNKLDWVPQAVVLLNDALYQQERSTGVTGWIFFSSVLMQPEAFVPETKFLAGPSAYFVPCRPPKEVEEQWKEASFEAKLQLSSDQLLCHWVPDDAETLPIWSLEPGQGNVRHVRHWPSAAVLEESGHGNLIYGNLNGKPQGAVIGLFEQEGLTRLFCSRATECFERTSGTESTAKVRGIDVDDHRQWLSDQTSSKGDDIVACLRRLQEVADTEPPQTITYQEARAWLHKAPIAKKRQ